MTEEKQMQKAQMSVAEETTNENVVATAQTEPITEQNEAADNAKAQPKEFVAPQYVHARWDEILDDDGNNVFQRNTLYAREQIFGARYCAFLQDERFRCSMKLADHERQMCEVHYQQWRDQLRQRNDERRAARSPNRGQKNQRKMSIDDATALRKRSSGKKARGKQMPKPQSRTVTRVLSFSDAARGVDPNAVVQEMSNNKPSQPFFEANSGELSASNDAAQQVPVQPTLQQQRKRSQRDQEKRREQVHQPMQSTGQLGEHFTYAPQAQLVGFVNYLTAQVQQLSRAYELERAQRIELEIQLANVQRENKEQANAFAALDQRQKRDVDQQAAAVAAAAAFGARMQPLQTGMAFAGNGAAAFPFYGPPVPPTPPFGNY